MKLIKTIRFNQIFVIPEFVIIKVYCSVKLTLILIRIYPALVHSYSLKHSPSIHQNSHQPRLLLWIRYFTQFAVMAKKHHEALADASLFHNAIHGLSLLDYHLASNQDTTNFRNATSGTRKHVSLLEGLALLLVAREKGDVAATGLKLESNGVRLYWAKNSNSVPTKEEQKYIERLQELFVGGANVYDILSEVSSFCRRKIISRCKKVVAVFSTSFETDIASYFKAYRNNEDYLSLEQYLRGLNYLGDNVPLYQQLGDFVKVLAELDYSTPSKSLLPLLQTAYILTATGPTVRNMTTRDQWNRLSKLGDYQNCCKRILKAVGALHPKVRGGIETVQVNTLHNVRKVHADFDDVSCWRPITRKAWKFIPGSSLP